MEFYKIVFLGYDTLLETVQPQNHDEMGPQSTHQNLFQKFFLFVRKNWILNHKTSLQMDALTKEERILRIKSDSLLQLFN